MTAPVRVGVVGLGFMGRVHLDAYARARAAGFDNEIVAVCDRNPERRRGVPKRAGNLDVGEGRLAFDPASVRAYERPEDLIEEGGIDLLSITTPTPSHVPLAVRALERDIAVLVEKPVALDRAAAERLAEAEERSASFCLPALCMRFWPEWRFLAESVRGGRFGRPLAVALERIGTRPAWSDFYADVRRSGGVVFDLHVHDVDFLRHLFGEPDGLCSVGTDLHVSTLFRFEAAPHAQAEAGWDADPSFPFTMRARFVFEEATAVYDLHGEPRLRLHHGGRIEEPDLESVRRRFGADGYEGEVRHALRCVRGEEEPETSAREAVGLTILLERIARRAAGRI